MVSTFRFRATTIWKKSSWIDRAVDWFPFLLDPLSCLAHKRKQYKYIYWKIDQLKWQNKIVPLKFNSSFGKLFASHAGVSRTGFAKNGARSTSVLPLPSTLEEMNTYAWEMHARVWTATKTVEHKTALADLFIFICPSGTPKMQYIHQVRLLAKTPTQQRI